MKIILEIPDDKRKYIHLNFKCDASSLLRYFQQLHDQSGLKEQVENIEEYLKRCLARQSFFILVTEEVLNPQIYHEIDFLKEDDVNLKD
jgi:hypothetical protein